MRTYILLLVFAAFYFANAKQGVLAQSTHYHYKFEYDDAGNRDKRIYLGTALKSANTGTAVVQNNSKPVIDKIGLNEVKIYPNPTKGKLVVEIPQSDIPMAQIVLVNMQGKIIINKDIPTGSSSNVDLTRFSSGIYVMKIIIGQDFSDWKIIKE